MPIEPSSFISTNKKGVPASAIQASSSISEVVAQFPVTAGVFERWGLNPQQQTALQYESLSATCLVHHIECDTLIAELEAAL